MDLGILVSDVATYAGTTFGSAGAILALVIGAGFAVRIIKRFTG